MGSRKIDSQVRILLTDTILALCKNTLNQYGEVAVEGLLGITLDKKEIFLVSLQEVIRNNKGGGSKRSERSKSKHSDDSEATYDSDDSTSSRSKRKRRKKHKRSRSTDNEGTPKSKADVSIKLENVEDDDLYVTKETIKRKRPNVGSSDQSSSQSGYSADAQMAQYQSGGPMRAAPSDSIGAASSKVTNSPSTATSCKLDQSKRKCEIEISDDEVTAVHVKRKCEIEIISDDEERTTTRVKQQKCETEISNSDNRKIHEISPDPADNCTSQDQKPLQEIDVMQESSITKAEHETVNDSAVKSVNDSVTSPVASHTVPPPMSKTDDSNEKMPLMVPIVDNDVKEDLEDESPLKNSALKDSCKNLSSCSPSTSAPYLNDSTVNCIKDNICTSSAATCVPSLNNSTSKESIVASSAATVVPSSSNSFSKQKCVNLISTVPSSNKDIVKYITVNASDTTTLLSLSNSTLNDCSFNTTSSSTIPALINDALNDKSLSSMPLSLPVSSASNSAVIDSGITPSLSSSATITPCLAGSNKVNVQTQQAVPKTTSNSIASPTTEQSSDAAPGLTGSVLTIEYTTDMENGTVVTEEVLLPNQSVVATSADDIPEELKQLIADATAQYQANNPDNGSFGFSYLDTTDLDATGVEEDGETSDDDDDCANDDYDDGLPGTSQQTLNQGLSDSSDSMIATRSVLPTGIHNARIHDDSSVWEEDEYLRLHRESEITRDVNVPEIYIPKILDTPMTRNGKKKKRTRVFNTLQYCAICGKMVANFSQHLQNSTHMHSPASLQIQQARSPEERKRITALVRLKFNHRHNMKVLRAKEGQLLLERRPPGALNIDHYGPCPHCLAWTRLSVLEAHQTRCKARPATIALKSAILTRSHTISGKISSDNKLLQGILGDMEMDEIGLIANGDDLIKSLGCQWVRYVRKSSKCGTYASQIMRLCARLLQNLRKLKPLKDQSESMWNYLTPENFNILVQASLLTTLPHMDCESELANPRNAIKLMHDLIRLLNIKIGKCVSSDDVNQRRLSEQVLKLMSTSWITDVMNLGRVLLNERYVKRQVKLPTPDDLNKLNSFIGERLRSLNFEKNSTYDYYLEVVELVAAKLLVYNQRRAGELESTRLSDYLMRKVNNPNVKDQATTLEKHLMESQEALEIKAKAGPSVPVILPDEVKKAVGFISDKIVRSKVGIDPRNPFLLAKSGHQYDSVVSCYEALCKQCQAADLKTPERITSINQRKYTATFTQLLDLRPDQRDWLVNHLGLNMRAEKSQCTSLAAKMENSQIAKVLLVQDVGLQTQHTNTPINDIAFEEIIGVPKIRVSRSDKPLSPEFEKAIRGTSHKEPNSASLLDVVEDFFRKEEADTAPKKTRKYPPKNRVMWTKQEELEIRQLFHQNFAANIRPKGKMVKLRLMRSKANNGVLHLRSVSAVKNKVFRMIK